LFGSTNIGESYVRYQDKVVGRRQGAQNERSLDVTTRRLQIQERLAQTLIRRLSPRTRRQRPAAALPRPRRLRTMLRGRPAAWIGAATAFVVLAEDPPSGPLDATSPDGTADPSEAGIEPLEAPARRVQARRWN
jgi:hypothetical protein